MGGKLSSSRVGGKLTQEDLITDLKVGKYKNIVIMCGAGISTSAGIPDFRSPSAGLYFKLQKYNLPYPEAVFEGSYFKRNPLPFFSLCRELYPATLEPTLTHKFFTLLKHKNILRRVYTQNIDALEFLAGLTDEDVIEAHGSFQRSYCIECGKTYNLEWLKHEIFHPEKNEGVPKCECGGVVRPDVVLFGESLPERFFESYPKDFKACDLLIVLGTSLTVSPFNTLVGKVQSSVPRIYINKTRPGSADSLVGWLLSMTSNIDFSNDNDLFWQGTCDDIVKEICEKVGWFEDLNNIEVQSI